MTTAGPEFETILYSAHDKIATITLNRPEQLNTIVPPMPDEVEHAVALATWDSDISVIVLRGAGRAFCGGYNFGEGFHHWDSHLTTDGQWDPGKDFVGATAEMDKLRTLTRPLGIAHELRNKTEGNPVYDVDHSASIVLVNPRAEFAGLFGAPHDSLALARDMTRIVAYN